MTAPAHAPLPWAVDPECGEMVIDATGVVVVDCGARPITPREQARANAELIARSVASRSRELTALRAAALALRSYQNGNSAPDLAAEVAEACERIVGDAEEGL